MTEKRDTNIQEEEYDVCIDVHNMNRLAGKPTTTVTDWILGVGGIVQTVCPQQITTIQISWWAAWPCVVRPKRTITHTIGGDPIPVSVANSILKISQALLLWEARSVFFFSTLLNSRSSVKMTFLDSHREFHREAKFVGKLSAVAIPSPQHAMLDSLCER